MGPREAGRSTAEGAAGRIAVIGIGCRFPGAADAVQLWENVLAGRQQFRPLPEQRLPLRQYYSPDPEAPDKTYASQAAVLDGFQFDWVQQRIPRSTFESADISHWLALSVAEAAMRSAGYHDGGIATDRFGVIVGNTLTGEQTRAQSMRLRWPYVRAALLAVLDDEADPRASSELLSRFEQRYKLPFSPTGADTLAGSLSNTIAGRICSRYDLGGGGYTVDGACASSLLAVTTAADRLCSGEFDVALAGGVDISLDPFELVGFAKAGALARDRMRVYDRRAAGFIPGEGCGFAVLRRLDDALAAGDRIFAVLRGWGISSDGRHPVMAPRLEGQVRALQRAYARAGLDPGRVDFVEGHGTGTPLGDRTELTALETVIGRAAAHPVGLTSLKAIVGHCKAAAGIGAFIKAVVGVNRRWIAPVPGCDEPAEVFASFSGRLFPARLGSALPASRRALAGVSAMGFGGINVHAVVESHGPPSPELEPSLPERVLLASRQRSEVFVLDAADWNGLQRACAALRHAAAGMSMAETVDLAAWCAQREQGLRCRAVVVAEDGDELLARLAELEATIAAKRAGGTLQTPKVWVGEADPARVPAVGLLFPGQGSQRSGAARFIAERFAWGRALVEASPEHAIRSLYPPDGQVIHERELADTRVAQSAVCLVSLLWLGLLRRLGIVPSAATGHSLGELGAMHAAGFFDEHTLLELAALRGELVARHARPGTMVALAATPNRVRALIDELPGYACVASINGPRRVAVSVEPSAAERLVELARQHRIGASPIAVSHAFHSELMRPAVDALLEHPLEDGPRTGGSTTLISSVLPPGQQRIESLREHLARHLLEPVDFPKLLRALSRSCDVLVEVGPGDVLTRLARAEFGRGGPHVFAVEPSPGDSAALQEVLGRLYVLGTPVQWAVLYEGRLVRPFVPAPEREFIVNPCERLASGGSQGLASLAEPAPLDEPAPAAEPRAHASEPALSFAMVQAIIAERTGFPLEMLEHHARLLDDLNLDSIKSGEVIGMVAARAGVAEHIDPTRLANATIADVFQAVMDAGTAHGRGSTGGALQLGRWVRSFVVGLQREPARLEVPAPLRPSRLLVAGSGGPWSSHLSLTQGSTHNPASSPHAGSSEPATVLVVEGLPAGAWARVEALAEPLRAAGAAVASGEQIVVVEPWADADVAEGSPSSLLRGFLKGVALENPDARIRLMTAAQGVPPGTLLTAMEHLAAAEGNAFAHVYLDREGRAWREQAIPSSPSAGPSLALGPSDVVLATGGGQGITHECVRALAMATGCRLGLVGRSSPADSEGLAANLRRLDELGVAHRYVTADITDEAQLSAAIAALESALGPVTVVVHGAGRNEPRRANLASPAEVFAELSPKVLGITRVLALLDSRALRAVVGLGSVIATTGMHGNAWYGLSNDLLAQELSALRRARPGCHVITVDFGAWSGVGMAARLGTDRRIEGLGLSTISPLEGARRFVRLALAPDAPPRVVVTAAVDPSTWPVPRSSPEGTLGLVDDTVAFPGVECRTRIELDADREPGLRDHRYQGTLLLAAVQGLESMARLARLTALVEGPVRRITEVELQHPIVIPEHGPLRLELRACTEEAEGEGDVVVQTSILSEATGYAKEHFKARIHLTRAPLDAAVSEATLEVACDPTLELVGRRDLYGPLLFQGPRFQWIGRVLRLDERDITFALEPPPDVAVEGSPWSDRGRRDALLQGGQALVPRSDALPESIESIERIAGEPLGSGDVAGPGLGHVRLLRSDREGFTVDAVRASADGRIEERITGIRFRRVRARPDRPSLALLRWPEREGTALLQRALDEAGVEARIRLVLQPGIGGAPRAERHERLEPVLAELLAHGPHDEPRAIHWTNRGPIVDDHDTRLSVSHDELFGVVVASRRPVGVDIEPIVEREPEVWQRLLRRDRSLASALTRSLHGRTDEAWTRVWAAREALLKATQEHGQALELRGISGDRVDLRGRSNSGSIRICTWSVPLGRGGRRVVAVAAEEPPASQPAEPMFLGHGSPLVETRPGTAGRTAVIHRIVTSFADCVSGRGTVPTSRLALWMGQVRELALVSLREELLALLGSGRWGVVTNYAAVELVAPLTAMSTLEIALEATAVSETSASIALVFSQFDRRSPRVVGRATQRFSWVAIEGGESRVAPLPPPLREFFTQVGAEVEVAPATGPGFTLGGDAPRLAELRYSTTLDDSNLVGNIYFARYFRWVEHLLAAHAGTTGRPVRSCALEYLREARPGDELELTLRGSQTLRGPLFVEISRQASGGREPLRLAVARVELEPA